MLDDVLSQLDMQTRNRILRRLLASDGLLRLWKTTVILATSSGAYMRRHVHVLLDVRLIHNRSPLFLRRQNCRS